MIFLIPILSIVSRAAGADWFRLKTVWGILFGLPFAYAAYHIYGHWGFGIAGFMLSWRGFELGHGTFWEMKGYNKVANPDGKRIQNIERLVRPIYKLFSDDIHKSAYSWANMAAKGLFIGLPAGWWGLSLAVLWPLAYWIGFRVEKQAAISEYLSGMFAGLTIVLAVKGL